MTLLAKRENDHYKQTAAGNRIHTRDFYRPEDESPGRGDIEHWLSNAESYFLIGDAMGKAMQQSLSQGKE